ncbi:hypothetical protein [Deinococcus deserti]|uniref:hypothetical protein n=1 Tax=Deinococcus deserti TaxID=310783 RepID=UPI0002FCCE99|nr:hypothetical protein [Deinococcus deserti]
MPISASPSVFFRGWPHLDAAAFVIGNVAPDSGRPNHDWTQFDPPRTVNHLLRPGEDEGCIPDLTFWRDYVQGERDLAQPILLSSWAISRIW